MLRGRALTTYLRATNHVPTNASNGCTHLGQITKTRQKIHSKNSWNWVVILVSATIWQVLNVKCIEIGNGNDVNQLKIALKNTWNHIMWTYFWHILPTWNHSAAAQSTVHSSRARYSLAFTSFEGFFPLGVLGLAKACSKPTTTTGTVLLTAGLFQDFAFIYTQPWNSPQTAQQPLLTQATTATRLKALVKAIVPNSPQWYRRRLYCTKAACYRLYNQTAIQQIATIPKNPKSTTFFC